MKKEKDIIDECMKAMPFGNIKTHTPENLPDRIKGLASELAEMDIENDELIEVIRRLVLWSECCAMKLTLEQRENLNWKTIEDAKQVLDEFSDKTTKGNWGEENE